MNTLLVRLSSMGDLIHTLPAITDLARHRPDVQLDWLCEAAFADIARLHPFIRRVHEMRWRYWRKHLFQAATRQDIRRLQRSLKAAQYDRVLDSQGLIKSALFANFATAPVHGLDKHSAREPLAALFYQHRYPVAKDQPAVERNRQLFAQAFGYTPQGTPDFGIAIPAEAAGSLKDLPPRYHVALHATSRDSKLWASENWLALLTQLHASDSLPVLLPWGNEAERARAQAIAAQLPFAQACPPLTLLQAAHLLAHAQAIIGVDTGLLHLANAANRPTIGIYTDSNPAKTGVQESPWAVNLGGIGQPPSVDEVFNALQRCLQNKEAA